MTIVRVFAAMICLMIGSAAMNFSARAAQDAAQTHPNNVSIDVDSPLPKEITLQKGDTVTLFRSGHGEYASFSTEVCCKTIGDNKPLLSAVPETGSKESRFVANRAGKGKITVAYNPPFVLESPRWAYIVVNVPSLDPSIPLPAEHDHLTRSDKIALIGFITVVILTLGIGGYFEGKQAERTNKLNS
jgi:hypothetical protein